MLVRGVLCLCSTVSRSPDLHSWILISHEPLPLMTEVMLVFCLSLAIALALPSNAANCGAPTLPPNSISSKSSGKHGDIAVLTCAAGYEQSYPESTACLADGTWETICLYCAELT